MDRRTFHKQVWGNPGRPWPYSSSYAPAPNFFLPETNYLSDYHCLLLRLRLDAALHLNLCFSWYLLLPNYFQTPWGLAWSQYGDFQRDLYSYTNMLPLHIHRLRAWPVRLIQYGICFLFCYYHEPFHPFGFHMWKCVSPSQICLQKKIYHSKAKPSNSKTPSNYCVIEWKKG